VPTSTSLNLRAVLKSAVTRSGMDVPARRVTGLTAPAKALHVAGVAHAHPQGVVLYVVPDDGDLEQSCADVTFFLSALEGLTAAAAERAVLSYPSHEVDPYRGLAPHVGVTSARARALHGIARGTARVVIASAAGLLPRISSPDRMLGASVELRSGQDIAPTDLAEVLVEAGFSREDPADEHGEFAVRGGIVDVFPAGDPHPVRLEFIGDTIESLRTYDPSTQRSIAAIDQVEIVPLRDVLAGLTSRATPDASLSPAAQDFSPADRSATLFDYLARARHADVVVSESDEVETNAADLLKQVQESYESARGGDENVPSPDALFADWDLVRARLDQ